MAAPSSYLAMLDSLGVAPAPWAQPPAVQPAPAPPPPPAAPASTGAPAAPKETVVPRTQFPAEPSYVWAKEEVRRLAELHGEDVEEDMTPTEFKKRVKSMYDKALRHRLRTDPDAAGQRDKIRGQKRARNAADAANPTRHQQLKDQKVESERRRRERIAADPVQAERVRQVTEARNARRKQERAAAARAQVEQAPPGASLRAQLGQPPQGPAQQVVAKSRRASGSARTVGSRAQVWHGTAVRTSGGLTKGMLKKNRAGRIVSRAVSRAVRS
ncbi:hypothetical protein WJX74_001572 [Apatococcus lobatus]|uniref:Uncharacterized protein n=1 Tax=Apatococcus lobatus TaxID=904363 RepID=A0AAW1SFQ1_9CHLO